MKRTFRLFALTTIAAIAIPTSASFAGERDTSGAFTNKKGKTTTWQKNKKWGNGSATKTKTWQNDRGEGSKVVNKFWDRDSGTASGTKTKTTAGGKTATNTWSAQKTEDGRISSGTREGFNGKTYTGTTTVNRNDDGSKDITKSVTNEEGDTRTVTKTINRYND